MDRYPISKRPNCIPIILTISQGGQPGRNNISNSHLEDISRLEQTFKELNFKDPDKSLCDCSKEKILGGLFTFSKRPDFLESDFLLCVIIGTGTNGCFKDTKGENVSVDEVIHIFNAEQCVGMRHKPKIFIIQTDDESIRLITPGLFTSFKPSSVTKIPTQADIFIYHCSIPKNIENFPWDEQSLQSIKRLHLNPGSILIRTICDELDTKKDIEIHQLSTLVNSKLLKYIDAINEGTFRKQDGKHSELTRVPLPVCTSQLRKRFQFINLPKETAV